MNNSHVRGFTLIELLIVIAIIGVLAGLGGVAASKAVLMAKKAKARTTVQTLTVALDRYKNDVGIYPPDDSPATVMNHLTGFKESPDQLSNDFDPDWHGPYYNATKKEFYMRQRNMALIDPWMKPYQFALKKPKNNVTGCDVWSWGPNGIDDGGSGDDIGNWQ